MLSSPLISPVSTSISVIRSISSPKNSTLIARPNMPGKSPHITSHTERTSMKIHIIPAVLNINQTAEDLIPVLLHARTQRNNHILIIYWTAETINTGNTDATIITSFRSDSAAVAERRSLSISSLMAESFRYRCPWTGRKLPAGSSHSR